MSQLVQEKIVRQRSREGNLNLGVSRPNVVIRCVRLPDEQTKKFWEKIMKMQSFHVYPEPGQVYLVRANVNSPHWFPPHVQGGVLLSRHPNGVALRNTVITLKDKTASQVEPFFPFSCFDYVADRP